jgi:oxygen-independent coproporphyrinogen-3 oxidase
MLWGLYIHVPFCVTKCPYCDFYSICNLDLVDDYLTAITKEAQLYATQFGPFDSLYIGGGTPSSLSEKNIEYLLTTIKDTFDFDSDLEFTFEANPGDVTTDKLKLLKNLMVNRISLGVQSFNQADLNFLGRRHNQKTAIQAIELIRCHGFDSLGLDLIYSIPGQTLASWMTTLKQAISFNPDHLSAYSLTIEPNTLMGEKLSQGQFETTDENLNAQLFTDGADFLETNRYVHYEVSNFALGMHKASRHNQKYWQRVPYLGLGPGAHSFDGKNRWWNMKNMEDYFDALSFSARPVENFEALNADQVRLEKIALGLRTQDGIELNLLQDIDSLETTLGNLEEQKLIIRDNHRIRPTRKGYLMADGLAKLFI